MAHKIFLSPSNQDDNAYATGNTNERVQCEKIASAAYNALTRCGFSVKIGTSGAGTTVRCDESNKFNANIHLPIHTNSSGNGTVTGGTLVMVRKLTGEAKKAGNALLKHVGAITPGKDYELKTDIGFLDKYLDEISDVNALSLYLEVEFHDTKMGSDWILKNIANIGEAIAKGICEYFGVTYKAPDGTVFIYNSGTSSYDGPVRIGHARGNIAYELPDQVAITDYVATNFAPSVVIRAKNRAVARAIAAAATAGCNNDKIGYSQGSRMTLYQEAVKVNYNLSRIEKECWADCASFAWLCAIIGCYQNNIEIKHGDWPPCTSTMRDAFRPYHDHFEFLDGEQYLTSADLIQLGDIVVKENPPDGTGHAAVIVEGADGGGIVIKINVELFDITTTSAKASVTVVEKSAGVETEIEEDDWFKSFIWSYELERLSCAKIEKIPAKKIKTDDLKKFTIEGLIPNNTYRLKIAISDSSDSSSANKIYSQGFTFSTRQDYPKQVENLTANLEELVDPELLNKNCTIAFKAPNTWGDYANSRPEKGYRVSLVLNGNQVNYDDNLFTFGDNSTAKQFTLRELAKDVNVNFRDTLQIGVQSWTKDERNNSIFDQEFPKCSKPIYLKFFLNDVDKLHLKIKDKYKRATLLNSKLEIE